MQSLIRRKAYIHNQMICENAKDADVSFVPVSLRRRLSQIEKVALYLLNGSAAQQKEFRCVFASHWGEWQRMAKLILQVCDDEEMSPWGFSTSVHNATAGLFALLRNNKESYTTVAADEKTLEMGILEALITEYPVLFVFAEEDSPKIYEPKMKNPQKSCGISFFLSKEKSDFPIEIDFAKNKTDVISEVDTAERALRAFGSDVALASDVALSFDEMKRFLLGETSEVRADNFTLRKI